VQEGRALSNATVKNTWGGGKYLSLNERENLSRITEGTYPILQSRGGKHRDAAKFQAWD